MTKKDYIIAIRELLQNYCLSEEARKGINEKFPLERSPLWKQSREELQRIYGEYKVIYS